jgi:hypothetical protein
MGGRCDGGAVARRTQGVGAMAGAIAKRSRGTPAAPRLRRPPLARRAVLARGQRAPRGARSARSADFGARSDMSGHTSPRSPRRTRREEAESARSADFGVRSDMSGHTSPRINTDTHGWSLSLSVKSVFISVEVAALAATPSRRPRRPSSVVNRSQARQNLRGAQISERHSPQMDTDKH